MHFGDYTWLSHRLTYWLFVGPFDLSLELDHNCRVPSCVNPAHCEPVTAAVNRQRQTAAGGDRCRRGHPFDEANTFRQRSQAGQLNRGCRECRRQWWRTYQRKPLAQTCRGVETKTLITLARVG